MKTDLLYATCSMLYHDTKAIATKSNIYIYTHTHIYNIYINITERRNHVCISLLCMIKESSTIRMEDQ